MDPDAKTIEVLVNSGEGFRREALFAGTDSVRSKVLPGLEFPAAPVFRAI